MTETVVRIPQPDQAALKLQAERAVIMAESFVLETADDAELAGEELRSIVTRKKVLEEQRMDITRPLDAAKKAIMELFRQPIERLTFAESVLKRAIGGWHEAQEAKRIAEQRELEAQAAAERARQQEEADRLAAEARALEAAGMTEGAAELQRHAVAAAQVTQMIVAPAAQAPAKVTGVSSSKRTDFEVTDKLALLQHVLQNPALINLVSIDAVALRRYVGALGEGAAIPGVRIFAKTQVAARRVA